MFSPAEIDGEGQLTAILSCGPELLSLLLDKDDPSQGEPAIKTLRIPKKNKKLGYRVVYKVVSREIDDALQALRHYLDSLYSPHPCAHGFIKGRGVVSNAKPHLDKKYVLNVDIKNFFESIPFDSIVRAFGRLGFNKEVSGLLAEICTYRGRLVAGLPTSCTVANIACRDMDERIDNFCTEHHLSYTRYADDITVSGDSDAYDALKSIIESFGFELNERKTKLHTSGRARYVTGLTVCDDQYPRVPTRFKRAMRQELYYMERYGVGSHIARKYPTDNSDRTNEVRTLERMKGKIDFVKSIEPELAREFYEVYRRIVEKHRATT